MEEPVWEDLPTEIIEKRAAKRDLVWVTGKTRGRFGSLPKAAPGDHGIVISSWQSSYGSAKLCILTEDGREVATTLSCARVFGTVGDAAGGGKWTEILLGWMDRTYVPIIVRREKGFKTPFAVSRDKTAFLVYPLNSSNKMWLNQDKVHPGDWAAMVDSQDTCVSVRVPEWFAKKNGCFGTDGPPRPM